MFAVHWQYGVGRIPQGEKALEDAVVWSLGSFKTKQCAVHGWASLQLQPLLIVTCGCANLLSSSV